MHNILYLDYPKDVKKADVLYDVQDIARRDGDGYSSSINWHDTLPPFESREEAEQWITDHDKGWYDDHAVLYKRYEPAKRTKKIEEYENKIAELVEAKKKYSQEHSVKNRQASHIGCWNCGSKLYRQLLRTETCPLCHKDLRPKTTLDKLQWYDEKIADYHKRIDAEGKKQKRSYKIMWLVKCEYHS